MEERKNRIMEAMRRGPEEGLTGPQIHSVVPGSWEEIVEALDELCEEGRLVPAETKFSDENYSGYRLKGE